MKEHTICVAILLGFCFLLAIFEITNHECPAITAVDNPGSAKITIHLSSGEKLYPSRAHLHPEHVQAIMPDGTAITMAWKQVESIKRK